MSLPTPGTWGRLCCPMYSVMPILKVRCYPSPSSSPQGTRDRSCGLIYPVMLISKVRCHPSLPPHPSRTWDKSCGHMYPVMLISKVRFNPSPPTSPTLKDLGSVVWSHVPSDADIKGEISPLTTPFSQPQGPGIGCVVTCTQWCRYQMWDVPPTTPPPPLFTPRGPGVVTCIMWWWFQRWDVILF